IGIMIGGFLGIFINSYTNKYFSTSMFKTLKDNKLITTKKIYIFLEIRNFLNNKWYLDFTLNNYFGLYIIKHSYETFYKIIDKGIIEIFVVNGLVYNMFELAYLCSKRQT